MQARTEAPAALKTLLNEMLAPPRLHSSHMCLAKGLQP